MATGPVRRERFSNDGSSTLSSDISSGDTSLTVNSATNYPADPTFALLIGNEIVRVTAVSGSTFTVVRGQEGTIAAPHSTGTTVFLTATSESTSFAFKEGHGELLYPKNRILDDSGATLTASSFTWLNQGSATSTDADDGGINMTLPSEANHQIRGKHISAPSTPWKLTTFCMFGPGYTRGGSGTYMGPFGRESSTGKIYMLILKSNESALWRMTNTTTFSAEVDSFIRNNNDNLWLQLEDDGTNVRGHVSVDGYTFEECFNEGRTSFMSGGIDQIGFGGSSGSGAAGAILHFKSWIVE